MGRDRDPGVKRGGMAGLRRKKGGKAGFENPYCGPSVTRVLATYWYDGKTTYSIFKLSDVVGKPCNVLGENSLCLVRIWFVVPP